MKSFLTFIFICHSLILVGQNLNPLIEVQGRILNKENNEAIPYAGVLIYRTQNATISDLRGYFKISAAKTNDTLFVSCIGFKKQIIPLSENKSFYALYLEPNIQLLSAITITPPDDSYLYELLTECRKKSSDEIRTSKAYYEIKSYAANQQIELLEAFFNADLKGYDLKNLELKTGRFALKRTGNRFFNSTESSRAIIMNGLITENEYFPHNPFEFSFAKMKKKFWLELEKKYVENTSDSVYVIRYAPKDTSGLYFNGRIWLNPLKKQLIKTTFECRNCKTSPFIPLFSTDNMSTINLNITKTYKEIDNKMFFNHIDFSYQFDYESRTGKSFEARYNILTNAVLHVYDYTTTFFIPIFSFDENIDRDYLKINAMPYNTFFWEYNNEFNIIDHDLQNKLFFTDNNTFSNSNWYTDNKYFKMVYESPFITWSGKRVVIKEVSGDTLNGNTSADNVIADKYRLSIKIFMDINTYADSTNVLTSTVFDPWETFYHLPVDSATNCFLNIIFDIYEFERRNFVKEIQGSGNNKEEILLKYNVLIARLDKLKIQYLKEVDRGTNIKGMEKWNQYVIDKLGIDNMKLFNIKVENN